MELVIVQAVVVSGSPIPLCLPSLSSMTDCSWLAGCTWWKIWGHCGLSFCHLILCPSQLRCTISLFTPLVARNFFPTLSVYVTVLPEPHHFRASSLLAFVWNSHEFSTFEIHGWIFFCDVPRISSVVISRTLISNAKVSILAVKLVYVCKLDAVLGLKNWDFRILQLPMSKRMRGLLG